MQSLSRGALKVENAILTAEIREHSMEKAKSEAKGRAPPTPAALSGSVKWSTRVKKCATRSGEHSQRPRPQRTILSSVSENTSRTMPWAHGGVAPDETGTPFGKT